MSVENSNNNDDTNNPKRQHKNYIALPGFGEHKRAVSSVKFAPTRLTKRSALCASSSADGVIKLWDMQDAFHPSATTATTTASNATGSTTVTATTTTTGTTGTTGGGGENANNNDNNTNNNNQGLMEPKVSCTGHSRGINEICWNPVSPLIASASDDKTVRNDGHQTKINIVARTLKRHPLSSSSPFVCFRSVYGMPLLEIPWSNIGVMITLCFVWINMNTWSFRVALMKRSRFGM
jgi:WD40 repeat protein